MVCPIASGSSHTESKPFLVEGTRVGTVLPRVMPHLQSHPDVFTIVMNDDGSVEHVTLAPSLKTFEERTKGVNDVMEEFRKNDVFVTLRGWREEEFAVSRAFNERKFFKIERSAACLLGVTQYGVHINGYFRKANSDLYMWIARRSANKPTGPGKLDQMAAGGITYSSTITETLIKECKEEASVPEHIARHAVPVGSVSFTFETEKGLFPGVQFIYDLCLPEDFTPSVNDGEVSDFYCWPIDKVKEKIITNEFKPNCALVVLDFLIRHGEINPQTGT
ncbi:predicted protein [Nematostella vectensis]|uniref:Nudix hydrolase domain-containing protein n=1 Tax=Nematostella vectensis TaxID=45351 RepID=A7RFK4_NEMVE|nr:predicted protein [Nematostella vectensis]|eukprot:XP_001641679.1 predicted protein [Nematostella vectensis]